MMYTMYNARRWLFELKRKRHKKCTTKGYLFEGQYITMGACLVSMSASSKPEKATVYHSNLRMMNYVKYMTY